MVLRQKGLQEFNTERSRAWRLDRGMSDLLIALVMAGCAGLMLLGYLAVNVKRCLKKACTCQRDIAGLCESFDLALDHFLSVEPRVADTLRGFFIGTVAVQNTRRS